jgi:hypothetical protein
VVAVKKPDVSQADLAQLLSYDPQTGLLTWKPRPRHLAKSLREHNRWNTTWAGKQAGSVCSYGYVVIKVHGRPYRGHRIAWALHYGTWPDEDVFIDHVNLNKSDNRIDNLRLASRSENGQNRAEPANNTSGKKGVLLYNYNGYRRWVARIGLNRHRVHIGYFDSYEEACIAYDKAARRFYGTFAREA